MPYLRGVPVPQLHADALLHIHRKAKAVQKQATTKENWK